MTEGSDPYHVVVTEELWAHLVVFIEGLLSPEDAANFHASRPNGRLVLRGKDNEVVITLDGETIVTFNIEPLLRPPNPSRN